MWSYPNFKTLIELEGSDFIIQIYYVFISLNGINILLKKLYEELQLGIILCASYHAFTKIN
jgi:hypothetical protein